MARKRIDADHEAARARIKQAMKDPAFCRQFDRFFERWRARGYPNLYWEERDADYDEDQRRMVYRGMFYELRDLCDSFGLWWAKDAPYLMRTFYARKEGSNEEEALRPDDCPPPQHWQWFRMAKLGWRLPRANEIAKVPQVRQSRTSNRSSQRSLADGLTVEDIATSLAGKKPISPETVRRAIHRCQEYLSRGGFSFNDIAARAGLTDDEALMLFLSHK